MEQPRPLLSSLILTRRDYSAGIPNRPESRAVREALEGQACFKPGRRCITHKSFFPARETNQTEQVSGLDRIEWTFFSITLDPALYMPVLQFAPLEMVFPGSTDTLPGLINTNGGEGTGEGFDVLLNGYLSRSIDHWKRRCVVYYTAREYPGTWLLEFWFYYPFDVGGRGRHFHDSEHVFVEVDVLGGWVRRVLGAGHGAFAGNNIYDATGSNAVPVDLPLLVAVEMGKHATAPDIDRDFLFTPGIDENYYGNRAKVWAFAMPLATTTSCSRTNGR